MAEDSQNNDSAQPAAAPESLGLQDPTLPEFRSRTDRKPDPLVARFPTLYHKDQGIWLTGARSLKGPYTIAKVHDDGTYDLNNESGTPFKYKVKERDLKPL